LPFGGKFAMLRKCEITEKPDKTDRDDENHAKDQISPVYVKPAKSQTISPPVRNVRNFSEKRCNDRRYVQSKRSPRSKIPLNLRDALKKRPGPGRRIMSDRRRQRRTITSKTLRLVNSPKKEVIPPPKNGNHSQGLFYPNQAIKRPNIE
jgi:hypothetical protein